MITMNQLSQQITDDTINFNNSMGILFMQLLMGLRAVIHYCKKRSMYDLPFSMNVWDGKFLDDMVNFGTYKCT